MSCSALLAATVACSSHFLTQPLDELTETDPLTLNPPPYYEYERLEIHEYTRSPDDETQPSARYHLYQPNPRNPTLFILE